MNIDGVEAAFKKVAINANGRLKRGIPHGEDGIFYIGCGEKGEKYTLRRLAQWRDNHWQDNLEHLGADPENALRKALELTGDSIVYFEPFVLIPGSRGPRPEIPIEKQRITFGQYRGRTFESLLEEDRGYLEWLARSAQDKAVKTIAQSLVGIQEPEGAVSDWSAYVLNFGKHSRKTLGDILRDDPNYLFWLAKSAHDEQLRLGIGTLIGPANIPFMAVDVDAVLNEAGLIVRRDEDGWAVHGNTYPIRNLLGFLGGEYDPHYKRYWFGSISPLEPLVLSIVDTEKLDTVDKFKIDPDGAPARARARVARLDFDGQVDCRVNEEEYAAMVSEGTVNLLQRGLQFGIPQTVIDEQIADAGRMVNAFLRGEPLFLLASEAGAGKTFVLGAAAREILLKAPQTSFCYVTLRSGLIKQIKSDLGDYEVLNAFEFHTYNGIGKKTPLLSENTIAIFDEGHTAKNLESKAGSAAEKMAKAAKLAIYASATPYEDPSEMAYLAASGLFEPHGFEAFAMGYGATPERKVTPNGYGGTRVTTRVVWRNSTDSLRAAAAGRVYLQKRGIYTQRKKRLPAGMVSSKFHKVSAEHKWINMFHHVSEAYDYAAEISAEMGGNAQMLYAHKRNLQKRILEAAKVTGAISLAKAAAADSWQSVIFVETKAQRYIGNEVAFDELMSIYTTWKSFPPSEREYPPPVTINQLALAKAFEDLGVDYQLPSVVDEIVMALGRENTGVYVGEKDFETLKVTDATAEKDITAWKAGKLPFLVATMAKGGTGLSLHPVKKKQPRLQIGLNLPWKAYGVDQVSGRCARYGMLSEVAVDWLFCTDIPLERELASKVGARMAGMGASVSGITTDMSEKLMEWDMETGLDVNYQGFTEIASEP